MRKWLNRDRSESALSLWRELVKLVESNIFGDSIKDQFFSEDMNAGRIGVKTGSLQPSWKGTRKKDGIQEIDELCSRMAKVLGLFYFDLHGLDEVNDEIRSQEIKALEGNGFRQFLCHPGEHMRGFVVWPFEFQYTRESTDVLTTLGRNFAFTSIDHKLDISPSKLKNLYVLIHPLQKG